MIPFSVAAVVAIVGFGCWWWGRHDDITTDQYRPTGWRREDQLPEHRRLVNDPVAQAERHLRIYTERPYDWSEDE